MAILKSKARTLPEVGQVFMVVIVAVHGWALYNIAIIFLKPTKKDLKFLKIASDKENWRTRERTSIEDGGRKMTIFPNQIGEVLHLYNRVSKMKPSTLLEKESDSTGPRDMVSISEDAKKQQILSQAKSEVLERIRDAK